MKPTEKNIAKHMAHFIESLEESDIIFEIEENEDIEFNDEEYNDVANMVDKVKKDIVAYLNAKIEGVV